MIKAIETEYKGYRFRSRLEARWAVFFDALGIKWEYEKEGFDLGPAGLYLPDFWLPQVEMWGEVKGQQFTAAEANKCIALVRQTGYPCLKLIGVPENKPYPAIEISDIYGVPCEVDHCLTTYHEYPFTEGRFYAMPGNYGPGGDAYWDDTEMAATAARSARFEHGETPNIQTQEDERKARIASRLSHAESLLNIARIARSVGMEAEAREYEIKAQEFME